MMCGGVGEEMSCGEWCVVLWEKKDELWWMVYGIME